MDSADAVLFQGVFDCSEHSDTGYTHGTPFAIDVVTVDGLPVEVSTANAYLAMQEAASHAGVALRVVSGFRTMAQQEYLYGCYTHCNCNDCNLAAVPGTSNHQSGHALDLNTSDPGVLAWLNAHGAGFGFSRTVASEDWHWEWWGHASDYPAPCGVTVPPGCASGTFTGAFCDDDGTPGESAHQCLVVDLGVPFACDDMDGHAAFCGARAATRAETVYVLGDAAGMPHTGQPDAFVDDNGDPLEVWMNAAHAFGIVLGDGAGHGNPNGTASRSTLAVIVVRMYALPPATRDWFLDDDGSSLEDFHNRLAEAGLTVGCGTGDGTRNRFCGGDALDRTTLASFACNIAAKSLRPIWAAPVTPPVDAGVVLDAGPSAPVDAGVVVDPPDALTDAGPDPVVQAPPEDEVTPQPHALPKSVQGGCASSSPAALGALALALLVHRRRARSGGLAG